MGMDLELESVALEEENSGIETLLRAGIFSLKSFGAMGAMLQAPKDFGEGIPGRDHIPITKDTLLPPSK